MSNPFPKLTFLASTNRKYHFDDFVPCPCCDRLDIKFCEFCGRVGFRGEVEFEAPVPSKDVAWQGKQRAEGDDARTRAERADLGSPYS